MSQARVEQADRSTVSLGFWLYLMTDCLLFATLFATFAVLRDSTAGGVAGHDIFDMNYVLVMSIILLISSVTSGFALIGLRRKRKNQAIGWLLVTVMLGLAFVFMELNEFSILVAEGNSWQASAFLSAFFTLVGTHGLHISIGIIWAVMLIWAMAVRGISSRSLKQLTLFVLFWHFLDIIWIFIFTFVYAIGSIA